MLLLFGLNSHCVGGYTVSFGWSVILRYLFLGTSRHGLLLLSIVLLVISRVHRWRLLSRDTCLLSIVLLIVSLILIVLRIVIVVILILLLIYTYRCLRHTWLVLSNYTCHCSLRVSGLLRICMRNLICRLGSWGLPCLGRLLVLIALIVL